MRPTQNGRYFADDRFKYIFLNENVWISIKISLKFVPKGPINNSPALVQITAWYRPGNKPLSESMMVRSLTYICVTWPQWINWLIRQTHTKLSILHNKPLIRYRESYHRIKHERISESLNWGRGVEYGSTCWIKTHSGPLTGQLTLFDQQ